MTGETSIIKKIVENEKYFDIDLEGSYSFSLDKKYGIVPKIGDTIILYTKNVSLIRGVDLNGVKLFYKTDEELQQEHKEWCNNYEKEQQAKFKLNEEQLNRDYKSLPKIFQKRIDRFRANNPKFRVDFEDYEIFCCKEAVKIAEFLQNVDAINNFHNLPWDNQIQMVPNLSDQHSGNTFDTACKLACLYLNKPIMVALTHGALSPLVGGNEYGDRIQ